MVLRVGSMSLSRINKSVLTDAGFWIGLCDPSDGSHSISAAIFESASRFTLVLPWPLLYEVLRTRLVRQALDVQRFERALRRVRIERIDDTPYREQALEATLRSATASQRSISLVDMVLRLMIENVHLRVHAVITYNPGDFADSCRRRRIPLIRDAADLATVSEA